MQLTTLLDRLKMEHLQAQLDPICEQASKADLDYKAFLTQALDVEWRAAISTVSRIGSSRPASPG